MNDQLTNLPTPDVAYAAMSLVMDSAAMDKMIAAAHLMASAKVSIPKHLQNSDGDCMAIIMQAAQWKMNPFSVAQKTYLQNGALGYEAQLINAVIVSSGALTNQPEFEFLGDWGKILGKTVEATGGSGGKYYKAGWSSKDEDGLGVICRATLRGESAHREITVMLSQCQPRFSTQWATDPQQQITYVAVRKFARRYAPGAILGVYAVDEIEPAEKDITPDAGGASQQTRAKSKEKALYSDADFRKNFPTWEKMIASGDKTHDDIIAKVEARALLTAEQKGKIMAVGIIDDDPVCEITPLEPIATYAEIADGLNKAKNIDALDVAADLINALADETQKDELRNLYINRRKELDKS